MIVRPKVHQPAGVLGTPRCFSISSSIEKVPDGSDTTSLREMRAGPFASFLSVMGSSSLTNDAFGINSMQKTAWLFPHGSYAAREVIGESQREHDEEPESPARRRKPEQHAIPDKAHKKQETEHRHEHRDEDVDGRVVAPRGAKAAPKEMPRRTNSKRRIVPLRSHSRRIRRAVSPFMTPAPRAHLAAAISPTAPAVCSRLTLRSQRWALI